MPDVVPRVVRPLDQDWGLLRRPGFALGANTRDVNDNGWRVVPSSRWLAQAKAGHHREGINDPQRS